MCVSVCLSICVCACMIVSLLFKVQLKQACWLAYTWFYNHLALEIIYYYVHVFCVYYYWS